LYHRWTAITTSGGGDDQHNTNNNSIIGGDETPTHYVNEGKLSSNQVSHEGEGTITNINSLQTFNMKRNLPILMMRTTPSPQRRGYGARGCTSLSRTGCTRLTSVRKVLKKGFFKRSEVID
jgi:hypothetical protein